MQRGLVFIIAAASLIVPAMSHAQERLPQQVAGSWRIVRILPSTNTTCWDETRARTLVGSVLSYQQDSMRWKGGSVPLNGITTRRITPEVFAQDYAGLGQAALQLASLHIPAAGLTEVDLQHDDMDITGATTEVPGDTILLAAPGRIIVSACGVFYEATRVTQRAAR
jgi:hypothetical protein